MIIAFDADDTLWHNEGLYSSTQEKLKGLLTAYCSAEEIDRKLYEIEIRNLEHFGYGIKGFTLSMIETAIELTGGEIRGHDIQKIVDFAKAMVAAPIELLDGVAEVISMLSQTHRLWVITKGDLFDQETKIARSGIADYFEHIEVVSWKNEETYRALLENHEIDPQNFLMVGNSLASDVLPVVAIGGHAVHIPYHTTWAHEQVADVGHVDYVELAHIREVPQLVATVSKGA